MVDRTLEAYDALVTLKEQQINDLVVMNAELQEEIDRYKESSWQLGTTLQIYVAKDTPEMVRWIKDQLFRLGRGNSELEESPECQGSTV